ncbi:hypothetical protein DRF65_06660 [Chryseobacterium pennae]|uniref:Uncharacterized protein n=1 Tax=Chryseobacterium pennae TaxID=2258962 RepID=A0A3D9CC07_9FLAO|nr:hypothetical protein [Chryseobacterium pennae]REC63327.1 hypothetical protein DRF65_06660 [Chryseobacterium pennae]
MRGKIILRLALLSVLTLFIYSCRTEDEVLPKEEQAQFRAPIEMFLKFEEKAQADPEFRSQNRQQASGQTNQKNASYNTSPVNIPISQVSYKLPFRETIESFFQNNPALGLEFYKDFGNPFYNVSTYTYGDSSKAIAFPILQGDRVTAFIHGIVTPNRDYVQFTIVQNNDPVTLRVLAILQDAVDNLYPKNPTPMGKFAKEQNIRVNDIEEITIIKFNVFSGGGGGFGYMFPGREWWKDSPWKEANGAHLGSGGGKAMSGDGSKHKFPDYLDPEDDPCEKTKKLLDDIAVQLKVKDLKEHVEKGAKGEKGWKFNKDGSAPTETTENGEHSVNFGDPSTINGGYHNHTETGVHIFSSDDISTLIEIARYQSIGNTGDAYMGVVAPGGIHYVMYFDGSHGDLPIPNSYSELQRDTWNVNQKIQSFKLLKVESFISVVNGNKELNSRGLEQIFFSTLKSMGLENKINLQKIDYITNNVSTIKLNSDGSTSSTVCPNQK